MSAKLKARRIKWWLDNVDSSATFLALYNTQKYAEKGRDRESPIFRKATPVAVIPLDDVDGLVFRIAYTLCRADGLRWKEQRNPMTSGSGANDAEGYMQQARAALTAVGVLPKGRGK